MSEVPPARPARRLFRADSPTDVVCAALVAQSLPAGHSVLALCTDKCMGDAREMSACQKALSRLYDWNAVVDVSNLPINQHAMGKTRSSRLTRIRDTRRSVDQLRQTFAPAFGLDPHSGRLAQDLDSTVDEVYFTCVYHPDILALYRVFPRAKKVYYPHGFDSLAKYEMLYYDPYFSGSLAEGLSSWTRLAHRVQGVVCGEDSVPVTRCRLDAAYYFNLPAPWTQESHSLAHYENRESMRRLFDRLPQDVQDYYRSLAAACGRNTALLLACAESGCDAEGDEIELRAYSNVVRRMVEEHGVDALVVKPHPMNSREWIERVTAAIQSSLPDLLLRVVDEYRHYPIEIALAPFEVPCAATTMSSALRNVRIIYSIPCYCPEDLVRQVWSRTPRLKIAEEWFSEYRQYYTAV